MGKTIDQMSKEEKNDYTIKLISETKDKTDEIIKILCEHGKISLGIKEEFTKLMNIDEMHSLVIRASKIKELKEK